MTLTYSFVFVLFFGIATEIYGDNIAIEPARFVKTQIGASGEFLDDSVNKILSKRSFAPWCLPSHWKCTTSADCCLFHANLCSSTDCCLKGKCKHPLTHIEMSTETPDVTATPEIPIEENPEEAPMEETPPEAPMEETPLEDPMDETPPENPDEMPLEE